MEARDRKPPPMPARKKVPYIGKRKMLSSITHLQSAKSYPERLISSPSSDSTNQTPTHMNEHHVHGKRLHLRRADSRPISLQSINYDSPHSTQPLRHFIVWRRAQFSITRFGKPYTIEAQSPDVHRTDDEPPPAFPCSIGLGLANRYRHNLR